MERLIFLFSFLVLFTNCQKEEHLQNLELIGTWKQDYCEVTQNGNTTTSTITTDDYLVLTENEGCYITALDTVCHLYTIQQNTPIIQWNNGENDIYSIENDTLSLNYITPAIETKCYFTKQ